MSGDLRIALVLTGDGRGLTAVLQSASGEIKDFSNTNAAAATAATAAAGKVESAWMKAGASIGTSLGTASTSASRFGATINQVFAGISSTVGRATSQIGSQLSALQGTFNRLGPQIQNLGYQVGDFAVQVASGGNWLRAFIQQGSQLIGGFGPWGAVISAAGAAVGALAIGLGGLGNSTDKAKEALDAYGDTIDHAQQLMQALRGQVKLTEDAINASARNMIATAASAVAQAQAQLDKTRKAIAPGRGPSAANPDYNQQQGVVSQQQAQQDAIAGTFSVYKSTAAAGPYTDRFSALGTDNSANYYKEQKRQLDELLTSMQKDADLAALSGKAHAERQAIMQAEAAAQKDFEAGLRGDADLSAAEKDAVIAAADAAYTHADALKKSEQALRDAQQQQQAHQKAVDAANQSIDGQISALDEELYQLTLSDRERYIRQQLLRAEAEAAKANTQVTQEQVEAIRTEAGALFDANQQIADRKKIDAQATQDAQKEAQKREQLAQQEADMMAQPFKNAIQGIQQAWTDGWQKLFSGTIDDFSSLFDSLKQIGIQWAAQMASLLTFRPAAGSILNAVSPGLAQQLGFGDGSLQNASLALGNGSGFSVTSLFGGSSGVGSSLAKLFGATGAPVYSNGIQIGSSMPGWANFLNGGVGTGLLGAAVSSGLTAATGGSTLQTLFSGGGSLLGGIAGSYFGQPALGAAAGGFLGNLLGGLFGDDKKPPRQKSITNINALGSGYFGVGGTSTSHSGDVTSQLGTSAVNALNSFLASIGGTVGGSLGGTNQVLYYGRTPRFMSTVGGVTNAFGDDEQGAEDAVADFVARTIVNAAKSGKLDGTSPSVVKALANSKATDSDTLDAAVQIGKFFDRIDQIRTPAASAASALADLASQMASTTQQAQQFGLDVSKVSEIYKENFNDNIASQLEQIQDPTQYALDQLDIEKAGVVAQAKELGADLNQVEALYAAKRQQIVEQGLQGLNNTFLDFFNGLLTGNLSALSPTEQLKQAKGIYDAAVASGDASQFTSAAQTYLGVAQSYYGGTKGYADIYQQVLTDTKSLGNLNVQLPAFDPASQATYLEQLGRNGDTHLVHVNDNELAALKAMGGSGTINPNTGLLEFFGDEGGGGLGGHGYGGAGPSGGDRNGGTHGGNSGSSGNGGVQGKNGPIGPGASIAAAASKGDASAKAAQKAQEAKSNAANGGNGNAPGAVAVKDNYVSPLPKAPAASVAAAAANDDPSAKAMVAARDYLGEHPNDADRVGRAFDAFESRLADYNNVNNSFMDNVGNFFAGLLGFNEIAPNFDVNNLNLNADWGFDPAGLIGSTIATAAGLPFGGGFIADQISKQLGRPLEVNLGPSVIGRPDLPDTTPVNDNSINSSLNQQRAAGLASTSSPASSSLAGAIAGPAAVAKSVDNRVSSGFASQNQRIASLESAVGKQARTQDAMLTELKAIRQSMDSQAQFTKLTQARRAAS